ncbi:alpha/beta hydrolase fold domain-containing protein [Mucilaginibacter daejeonensis]|uniref:alpha/beta hydrolase n=1 Tax=Mucilaginibacter daejeonensis TaxID=398049 RepID=UPI001D17482D|nr:alpha/beta hydrolase [Mucilaginibacter daejeonensis]UEG54960.1 alpha/beta hydrolase fold domain-containing protein [Mucilaginibacter daejeonensis]
MKKYLLVFLILFGLSATAQDNYVTETDIPYYADTVKKDPYMASQCKLDIYYSKAAKNAPTIVWFHGGGITAGKKELPAALKNKGYIIVGVGYRLSPTATAPAYIEDAAAAIAWVFGHAKQYGGNTKLIFISGHSAGGYLGMMCTLNKKYLDKYKIDANSIAGLIPFSGQAITHFTIRKERGIKETQPTIDEYAPLYFVRPDAPPMLLITGDREMELYGRYEENAYLSRMMKLAGHKATRLYELQGFDHGGMAEPAFPLLIKEVRMLSKAIDAD